MKLKGLVVLMVMMKRGSRGSSGESDNDDDDDATVDDSNRVLSFWWNIEISVNIDMMAMMSVMMKIEAFNSN